MGNPTCKEHSSSAEASDNYLGYVVAFACCVHGSEHCDHWINGGIMVLW